LARPSRITASSNGWAQAASALEHPNICTIFGIDETPDGRVFVAMSFYEGETLKQRIARGPLPLSDALRIAIQIAAPRLRHRQGVGANRAHADRSDVRNRRVHGA